MLPKASKRWNFGSVVSSDGPAAARQPGPQTRQLGRRAIQDRRAVRPGSSVTFVTWPGGHG
jgi:hypothetical protein